MNKVEEKEIEFILKAINRENQSHITSSSKTSIAYKVCGGTLPKLSHRKYSWVDGIQKRINISFNFRNAKWCY